MLFTLLTFPLRCTLDIEQCGRGPLFHGPFANEAIKSLLPRMWKGAGGWVCVGGGGCGESSAASANTRASLGLLLHTEYTTSSAFVVAARPAPCGLLLSMRRSASPEITGGIGPRVCAASRAAAGGNENKKVEMG